MTGVFDRLGVRRVVNCMGTVTFLGGIPLEPEVIDAMAQAARVKVDLNELLDAAGKRVAELVGGPAAYLTTGAAAAMELSAAACVAGTDPRRISRLPATEGMAHDIVIHRKHRCNFDHAFRNAGACLSEFGISHDGTEPWELHAAITDETVAVAYIASYELPNVLSLKDVIAIAHEHAKPVIVDAAVMLPPRSNLRRYVEMGADLVCYSGGKGLGGPQSTGFVVGRKDLIEACRANANPNHNTVGRPLKLTADAIAGLLVALERYVEGDDATDARQWRALLDQVRSGIVSAPDVDVWEEPDHEHLQALPVLFIRSRRVSAQALAERAAGRDPSVRVNVRGDAIMVNPHALRPEDVPIVIEAIREALGSP